MVDFFWGGGLIGTTSFRREMQIFAMCRLWKGKRGIELRGMTPIAVRAEAVAV